MNKFFQSSLVRFLIVGVGNTLLSMAVEFGLYNLAGLNPVLSSAVGYVAGATMSFFLNRSFTFHSEEKLGRSALKFAINVIVLWVLTHPLLQPWLAGKLQAVFVERWANNVSLVLCMALYTALNYLGQRFFAFRKRGKKQDGETRKEE
jgi:putative flippase GtrA